MRVLVCGGREYLDYPNLALALNDLYAKNKGELTIIQGEAKGADFLGKVYAYSFQLECVSFPADWKKYGKSAGHIRNKQMLEEGKPDIVVACKGDRGTASMMKLAREAGLEVLEIE